jgi:hypothetical protein
MLQTWVINLPLTDAEIEKENSFIFNFPFSDSVAEKMSKKCSMSNDADKSSSGLDDNNNTCSKIKYNHRGKVIVSCL